MVHHTSIFDDKGNTPTFNSLAIESQLANMQGLSEFVLYMNVSQLARSSDVDLTPVSRHRTTPSSSAPTRSPQPMSDRRSMDPSFACSATLRSTESLRTISVSQESERVACEWLD